MGAGPNRRRTVCGPLAVQHSLPPVRATRALDQRKVGLSTLFTFGLSPLVPSVWLLALCSLRTRLQRIPREDFKRARKRVAGQVRWGPGGRLLSSVLSRGALVQGGRATCCAPLGSCGAHLGSVGRAAALASGKSARLEEALLRRVLRRPRAGCWQRARWD